MEKNVPNHQPVDYLGVPENFRKPPYGKNPVIYGEYKHH
jgi:hypothetical protein